METVFLLATFASVPFWFLMIVLPGWLWTRRVMSSPWSVAWLPLVYAALVIPRLDQLLPLLVGVPRLAPIAELLGTPAGATIAWLHFLALDLFVGRWIYFDARDRRIPAWWTSPALVLTVLFAPLGLLTYLGLRELLQVKNEESPRPADGCAGA